jgi:glycosyltransferase involved in cell wall biosynthesis
MFHTEYAEPGGEDLSASMDAALLKRRGIDVCEFRRSNRDVLAGPAPAAALTLWRSHFNRQVYDEVRRFCRARKPDVAHVQNFWFALSPSVHAACHAEGVATVQTLRNYRLLCVNGLLMRDGGPCEDCVGRAPWRGVVHACYRESRLSSALVARMIQYNRSRGTWRDDVDVFVALTSFARDRYVAGGLPGERIMVRPNSVHDPGPATPPGTGAVFVGRLSTEKGIDTLLGAWRGLPRVPLTIVGDGPLRGDVERAAARWTQITYLGARPQPDCFDVIRRSAVLVMASRWYEGFPRVIIEAFALGRAVVAPRLGSMADVVRDGATGLLYEPGSDVDLVRAVKSLEEQPEKALRMGRAAREVYEAAYAPDANAGQLLDVYRRALDRRDAAGEPVEVSGYGRSPAC